MLIQNTGKYVRHIGVQIIPGVNNLSEEDTKKYLEAAKHPLNKYLVETGEIKVKGASLKELNANDALALVADTYDLKLLNDFQKEDTRKSIQDAIEKQIESIKNPPEDKIVTDEE